MKTQKQSKNLKAQILVLTLLSLFIISIIAVAIFNIASRDVRQTVQNREYARLQNIAENRVLELAARYANGSNSLSQVVTQLPCTQTGTTQYTCDNNSVVSSRIILEDTNQITNYPLGKDEYFEIDLANYRGSFYFSFTGNAALEFGLITQNASSQLYRYYGSLFDLNNVFTNNGGNPFSDPSNNHFLNFVNNVSFYSFNLNAVVPVNENPVKLRITARMPSQGSISLNLSADSGSPNFARRIASSTFDPNSATGVVATVSTVIPIAPQALSIFDYALLTSGQVSKP